ncbi:MAG: alkane 1-monooxygenase [Bacteroidia bacterium]|nr:alkane 1-monooxygenase [Bacteroidia bacterium]MBT8275570.1 alkane 1-monooxygenase [Bacteroidia bacterium]NNF31495.1 alkane 1-monooxygenase [Flavobacteriaceae bacterium]NNK54074.1 alkane 1-monooxygenase [Flavobacteriaceae bacterium]NNM07651.1 alkane 1-monooxygenase [Flavobacteriaceae bacterium]
MKDLKYLAAYSIPIVAIIGLYLEGIWTFLTPVYAFGFIPVLEIILSQDPANLTQEEASEKKKKRLFDVLLYLNLPIVYSIIGYFLYSLTWANYSNFEIVGLIFSVGIVLGGNGINVAHELGHRTTQWEKTLGKILLLPALYMHFFIEHNFGHHKNAATAEDPASAKYNQSVYSFWVSSMLHQYFNAWKIQKELLKREGRGFFSNKNDMFWYSIFQFAYLGVIFIIMGGMAALIAMAIALTAAVLLETINYIEHYGLSRKKLASGRYERVQEIHSWNSNHVLGRIMLYELTRHSDHHYKSSKKYQLLDCHESSPQMPFGYPTSMMLSLLPPLWFKIMNKRIPVEMRT